MGCELLQYMPYAILWCLKDMSRFVSQYLHKANLLLSVEHASLSQFSKFVINIIMWPDLGKPTFWAHWSVWCNYNHPYLLGERSFWCETSQQDNLIVALSKCSKKNSKNCEDFQTFACTQRVGFQDPVTYSNKTVKSNNMHVVHKNIYSIHWLLC